MEIYTADLSGDVCARMDEKRDPCTGADVLYLLREEQVFPVRKIPFPKDQCRRMERCGFFDLRLKVSSAEGSICDDDQVFIGLHGSILIHIKHKYSRSERAAGRPPPYPHTSWRKSGCR